MTSAQRILLLGVITIAAAGCVDTSTSTCATGARCPAGTVCMDRTSQGGDAGLECVPAARVHACTGKAPGDLCVYDEVSSAWCHEGVCTERICGDGISDEQNNEACDDGNNVAGDGCSNDCRRKCGDGFVQQDQGEICDVALPTQQSCLSVGFDMGRITCHDDCLATDTDQCSYFEWHPMPAAPETWHFTRVWAFDETNAVAVGYEGGLTPELAPCGVTNWSLILKSSSTNP